MNHTPLFNLGEVSKSILHTSDTQHTVRLQATQYIHYLIALSRQITSRLRSATTQAPLFQTKKKLNIDLWKSRLEKL